MEPQNTVAAGSTAETFPDFTPEAPDAASLARLQKAFSAPLSLFLGMAALPFLAFAVFQYAGSLALSMFGLAPQSGLAGLVVPLARVAGVASATALWWWFLRWRLYTTASNALGKAYQEAPAGLRMWLQAQALWLRADTATSTWNMPDSGEPFFFWAAIVAGVIALAGQVVAHARIASVFGLHWAGAFGLVVVVWFAARLMLTPRYRDTAAYAWPYGKDARRQAPRALSIPTWARPDRTFLSSYVFLILMVGAQVALAATASVIFEVRKEQSLYDAVMATAKNPKLTTTEKIASLQKQLDHVPTHRESAQAYVTGPAMTLGAVPPDFAKSQCVVLSDSSAAVQPEFCDTDLTVASVWPLVRWVATLTDAQARSLVTP